MKYELCNLAIPGSFPLKKCYEFINDNGIKDFWSKNWKI
jgi:hypothetical protein